MCFAAHVSDLSRCELPDGVKDVSTPSKSKKEKIRAEADSFDWSRVDALSDAEIEEAAKSDPDAVLLTDPQVAEADLVVPANARRRRKQAAE